MVKHDSILSIFALVVTHDMGIIQYDAKTTFVYGDLQEEIFMEQPKGYFKLETKQFVCYLHKIIYGLCQATHQWNLKFDFFMTKNNLVTSNVDPCVYHMNVHIETITGILWMMELFVLLLSPNLWICCTICVNILRLAKYLDYYVGFHVKCWREVGATFLHQTCYIKQIFNHFGIVDCHFVTTPTNIHTHLVVATDKDEIMDVPYKEIIGSLIYVMTLTCLDITYVVNYVAKFVERPTIAH